MRCHESLTLLLAAERDELEGRDSSAVAAHIRDCAKCRAVATQLLSDTTVLAELTPLPAGLVRRQLVPMRSAPRNIARPVAWTGALAAAAVVIFLSVPRIPARQSAPALASALITSQPVVQPAAAADPRTATGAPRRRTGNKSIAAVQATRFEGVTAATPVRFVASQAVDELAARSADSNGVAVSPPAGRRATVLATRNPAITVVWLY